MKLAAPKSPSTVPKPFTVAGDGFSLNAAVAFAAHRREGIERLFRYVTRPALALERLSTNGAAQVIYHLKSPYRDGTTHFVFEPLDLLARLAAPVPRPRGNLLRYQGNRCDCRRRTRGIEARWRRAHLGGNAAAMHKPAHRRLVEPSPKTINTHQPRP